MFTLCASRQNPEENRNCFRDWIESKKYLELIGWTLGGVAIVLLPFLLPQRQRPIPYQIVSTGDVITVIRDPQLNNPAVEESITATGLILYSLLLPLVIQILFGWFVRGSRADAHRTWCAYMTAVSATFCVTEVLKRHVGRLRPNTYALCGWDDALQQCAGTHHGDEYRKSFPSGHASGTFCGWALLACYLWNAANTGHRSTLAWRVWTSFSLLPLCVACYVASSRLVDNYHFVGDVVAGAVIGCFNAVVFTNIHFSSRPLESIPDLKKKDDESFIEEKECVEIREP